MSSKQSSQHLPITRRKASVGYAFKGKNQAAKKTELVVFLRPTVIGLADVKAGDLKAFEPLLPESLPMDDIDFGIGEPS